MPFKVSFHVEPNEHRLVPVLVGCGCEGETIDEPGDSVRGPQHSVRYWSLLDMFPMLVPRLYHGGLAVIRFPGSTSADLLLEAWALGTL